jgi:hypothetical protein
MTTSFDLNKAGILRVAYQMAGIVAPGQDPDSDQLAMGSDILNTQIKALQSEGIILTTVQQTTVSLVAGTAAYTLPGTYLDVDTQKPFVTGNGINVPLEWWTRGMYMALTVPSTAGQPTSIYVEESNPLVVHLYPVPDSSWTTLTVPTIALLPDLTSGADNTGLKAKYLRTLILGVAMDLALSFGLLARFSALEGQYENAKKIATNDDTERGSVRFIADYGYAFRGSKGRF